MKHRGFDLGDLDALSREIFEPSFCEKWFHGDMMNDRPIYYRAHISPLVERNHIYEIPFPNELPEKPPKNPIIFQVVSVQKKRSSLQAVFV